MPRVDRCNVKDHVSKWRASSSSTSRSVTKRVTASRLEAIAQDPGGTQVFFPNRGLLRALRWKRPLVDCCWTLRSHDDLAPPKILEKKEEVPRWNQCRTHWARQVGASSAWFYSLAWIFLSSPERFLRGSDRDPARQTETCEYEPCVTPSVRETKWKFRPNTVSIDFRVLCLFLLLFVFLFFFIFTFLETGKVKPPPPPPPQTGMPVFW